MLTVLTCSAATVPVATHLRRGFRASASVPASLPASHPAGAEPLAMALDLREWFAAGISEAPCGASSSSNSSGTGQFPFGKGLGDAAPGGVPSVLSHGGTADNNYPFSTN
ncbi:hypothetical protein NONO_c45860 [Nocardia nova SH22a]|uniref:Uncharacterized protein n=2 Tax=Nocardia nova TaxID=37330 RepID=W5TJ88_9NOCA|nr:hypothetical protein NONO_c45860 [Nocardia nova SH22a]